MIEKLRRFFQLKLGVSQNQHTVEQLNHRFDFLAAYMNLTWPSRLEVDKELMASALEKLKVDQQIESFNTTIHKNDLMFANSVYGHRHDHEKAIFSYFTIGIRNLRNLQKIAAANNLKPLSILDFGSGYGRVSRFFPKIFPHAEITVSEVKSQCLDFQKEAFGYKTVFHGQDPKSFKAERYDLIFALSVFTHLPQSTFEGWLKVLIDSLNPGGGLVFTFNDVNDEKHKHIPVAPFTYKLVSEDSTFSFVSDSIKDNQDYGSTFVSREYLESLLPPKLVDHRFLDKELAPQQEALLVIKK